MKTLIIIIGVFIISSFNSCQKENIVSTNNEEKLLTIKHRDYRGECQGYCDTELIFDTTSVTYIKKGWDTSSNPLPVIDTAFQISKTLWNSIISIINIDSIMKLDSIYWYDDSGRVSEGTIYFEFITTQRHKKINFPNRKYLDPVDSFNKILIKFRMRI